MCAALLLLSILAQDTATTELQRALAGSWTGTLEYRDFSEPSASTKRVKLPAWLTVEAADSGLTFRYVYDDGPGKTVTETSRVRIDVAARRYSVLDESGKVSDSYEVDGFAALREGRGTLTLTGTGTENEAPVNVRTSIRIGRNILEITRETAPSGQPYAFRHSYTFVRSLLPGR